MTTLRAVELYRFFHDGDGETAALRGVSLTLEAGEFVALLGPSGSGKSTLLACLAGLDDPDGGHVDILDQRLSRRPEAERARLRARHIGMLMQSGNLLDHLTIGENIQLQQHLIGERQARGAPELLAEVGIEGLGGALPAQLSGGETARAGLCVALAADPAILACDEPTAEVDQTTERDVITLLRRRCEAGTAVLVATHSEALSQAADRRILIRDGRLIA